MAIVETNKRFGVHSMMLHDISNGFRPYQNSFIKILNNFNINSTTEMISLNGGSRKDAWAAEDGLRTNEISLSVSQFEPAMFQQFAGAVMTQISASATGSIVNALINTKGTSMVDATTGFASVGVKSSDEADLKTGNYFVVATGAATFNLYIDTDLQFNRGTDVNFQDQTYKLLASDLTLPGSDGTVDASDYGLEFTGGSGTIALTEGDVAMFTVSPPHSGINKYSVGEIGEGSNYVGVTCWSEVQSDGSVDGIILPKVKFSGLPLNFTAKEFATADITGTPVIGCSPIDGKQKLYDEIQIRGVNTDDC
jgi:hypothetical protein